MRVTKQLFFCAYIDKINFAYPKPKIFTRATMETAGAHHDKVTKSFSCSYFDIHLANTHDIAQFNKTQINILNRARALILPFE